MEGKGEIDIRRREEHLVFSSAAGSGSWKVDRREREINNVPVLSAAAAFVGQSPFSQPRKAQCYNSRHIFLNKIGYIS